MESRFGKFGGQYVPETLMEALHQLEDAYEAVKNDEEFINEYKKMLGKYGGRPTPLYYAQNLSKILDCGKIYIKREDLNHTGSHKLNNVMGQILLARRMGKDKVIAETGAGQHGVATATVAAMFNMECIVFMGEEDVKRQSLNVYKMKLLGAEVVSVKSGSKTLKDATNEAIRFWVENVDTHYYVIGSVVGPHPYPTMVRDFQRIIGDEAREQILEVEGKLPTRVIACVGGGSNAMGIFFPFAKDKVDLIGVEAAGMGIDTNYHAAAINKGSIGVIHGMMTYMIQDEFGQIGEVHSVSAGLDYPGIGPEHSLFHETKRCEYSYATDDEALKGFEVMSKKEGIIPALESAHAVGYLLREHDNFGKDDITIINLSGRGDKDMNTIMKYIEVEGKDE